MSIEQYQKPYNKKENKILSKSFVDFIIEFYYIII